MVIKLSCKLFQDSQKRTALHLAVLAGNTAVITHLHHLSADAKDIHGNTPIHLGTLRYYIITHTSDQLFALHVWV